MAYEDEYLGLDENVMTPARIAGRIIKYLFIGLLLFIYLISIWRICSAKDPKSVTEFRWNTASYNAMTASPETFGILTSECPDYIDDDGLFAVSGVMRLGEDVMGKGLGQLQVTVRYNDSTVKRVIEKYGLESPPAGEPFIYILEDSDGNRYRAYQYADSSRLMYNYRRLIFDGIDFSGREYFTLFMYFVNDVDPDSGCISALEVWNAKASEKSIAVSEKDRPDGPDAGLRLNPAYLDKSQI